jgi:GDP-mannose transporter
MQIVVVEQAKIPLIQDRTETLLPPPVQFEKSKLHSGFSDITSSSSLALFFYCISSISMTVLNKYVLSSHHFGLPFLLLALQSLVCVLFLSACKRLELLDFRRFNKGDAIKWLPVSLLLIFMTYTGSRSLQHLTVAMFTVFKNITIIFIAFSELYFFGNPVSPSMIISFLLIVLIWANRLDPKLVSWWI